MNRFLRALAYVAPGAAMRRAQALNVLRYAGATAGRRGNSFKARVDSANTSISGALTKLRERSHEMVRDHWAFERILAVTVAHAIGTGITVRPANGSDRLDKLAGEAFEEWSNTCDAGGELDLGGIMALQTRGMLEGGNTFTLMANTALTRPGREVPLKLMAMEGEHLDHARSGMWEGHITRLGVALGEYDRREGYWLYDRHPFDLVSVNQVGMVPKFVRRENVIHLYDPKRAGQVLGVPIFAPILLSARDHADLMDALIVKAKIEACFSGFIKKNGEINPLSPQTDPVSGQRVTAFEPGMITELQQGEDITFATPGGAGNYDQMHMHMLLAMAAGAGITYDQMTGDLRQANYSSLRAGKIEFRRMISQLQWLRLIPMGYRRIVERWTRDAITAGVLRDVKNGYRWEYIMPANEPIDPEADLNADIKAVRAGRMSPQEFIGGWGRDWRKVMAESEEFFAQADKSPAGLVFDIDPRKVSQQGINQPAPATATSAPKPGKPLTK